MPVSTKKDPVVQTCPICGCAAPKETMKRHRVLHGKSVHFCKRIDMSLRDRQALDRAQLTEGLRQRLSSHLFTLLEKANVTVAVKEKRWWLSEGKGSILLEYQKGQFVASEREKPRGQAIDKWARVRKASPPMRIFQGGRGG